MAKGNKARKIQGQSVFPICVVVCKFVFVLLFATGFLIGLRLWRHIYDCAGLYSNVLNNEGKLERIYHFEGAHNFSRQR